jgi:hypothetical protein
MISGPMDGPQAFALNERLLQLLADAGLDPTDAARAAYLLIVYVFGSIALDVADLRQPGPLPPDQNEWPRPSPSPRPGRPISPIRRGAPLWWFTSPPSNIWDCIASSTAHHQPGRG